MELCNNILKKFKAKRVFASLLAVAVVLFGYSFIEPYWMKVEKVSYADEDIPESFNGFRIVFVADIHNGKVFSRKRVGSLVEQVNKLNPDLILLGGDYVDDDISYIKGCFEELEELEADYGVYAVLGNHDYWASEKLVSKAANEAGIVLLKNEYEWIEINNERFILAGVDDYWEGEPSIDSFSDKLQVEDFVLLLSHNPDYAEVLSSDKVDLMLAGHTHGGQITFFGLWAPLLPSDYGQKYRSGLVMDEDGFNVYVSKGVGLNSLPIRFGARPEITVIKLVSE